MGVLYPAFGITLNPALAAAAMALSSVSVVTNSLRLRGVDVRPGQVTPLRHGPLGMLRDGGYLLVIAALGLTLAGGVLAADGAITSSLPTTWVAATPGSLQPMSLRVIAGQWNVVKLNNQDSVVREWMVEGVPNLDLVARPGQTATLRFVLDTPGTYQVMSNDTMGTLEVVAP